MSIVDCSMPTGFRGIFNLDELFWIDSVARNVLSLMDTEGESRRPVEHQS